ncbi:MAG: hypothetical protein Q8N05_02645 [Bacteroidota bacterium]|nr:hypothetical protein [Bacteroidota bacterium]
MEKNTKTPIKAEIMGDRLIIDGHELRLEGLKNLAEFSTPKEFNEDILSLSISIAQIGALISESGSEEKVDAETLKMAFPSYSSLFALKVLSDSFKEM